MATGCEGLRPPLLLACHLPMQLGSEEKCAEANELLEGFIPGSWLADLLLGCSFVEVKRIYNETGEEIPIWRRVTRLYNPIEFMIQFYSNDFEQLPGEEDLDVDWCLICLMKRFGAELLSGYRAS